MSPRCETEASTVTARVRTTVTARARDEIWIARATSANPGGRRARGGREARERERVDGGGFVSGETRRGRGKEIDVDV